MILADECHDGVHVRMDPEDRLVLLNMLFVTPAQKDQHVDKQRLAGQLVSRILFIYLFQQKSEGIDEPRGFRIGQRCVRHEAPGTAEERCKIEQMDEGRHLHQRVQVVSYEIGGEKNVVNHGRFPGRS